MESFRQNQRDFQHSAAPRGRSGVGRGRACGVHGSRTKRRGHRSARVRPFPGTDRPAIRDVRFRGAVRPGQPGISPNSSLGIPWAEGEGLARLAFSRDLARGWADDPRPGARDWHLSAVREGVSPQRRHTGAGRGAGRARSRSPGRAERFHCVCHRHQPAEAG